MSDTAARLPTVTAVPREPVFDHDLGTLDVLRRQAAGARHRPRLDPFRACDCLVADPLAEDRAFAQALLRTLPEAFGRRPVFHRPDAAGLSFDERWLLRAIDRVRVGDRSSLAFLVRSRVAAPYRGAVTFLIDGLAAQLAKPPAGRAR